MKSILIICNILPLEASRNCVLCDSIAESTNNLLVWQATILVIWNAVNSRIFKNTAKVAEELIVEIKVLSWQWTLARLKVKICLLFLLAFCFLF